jgi:hypothetical protein
MTTVTRSIRFAVRGRRKRAIVAMGGDAATLAPVAGRVPRVSRLMALAIRFDELLRTGVVANPTELARLARFTQPRMKQILNLLRLAPDIQEDILFMNETRSGRPGVHERLLRPLVSAAAWTQQRAMWSALRGSGETSTV